jgi:hypothetical protein
LPLLPIFPKKRAIKSAFEEKYHFKPKKARYFPDSPKIPPKNRLSRNHFQKTRFSSPKNAKTAQNPKFCANHPREILILILILSFSAVISVYFVVILEEVVQEEEPFIEKKVPPLGFFIEKKVSFPRIFLVLG